MNIPLITVRQLEKKEELGRIGCHHFHNSLPIVTVLTVPKKQNKAAKVLNSDEAQHNFARKETL